MQGPYGLERANAIGRIHDYQLDLREEMRQEEDDETLEKMEVLHGKLTREASDLLHNDQYCFQNGPRI